MTHKHDDIDNQEELIKSLRLHYMASKTLYPQHHHDEFGVEWHRHIKPLREVTGRAVDFFALKMLPGSVSVVTESDTLKSAIEQVLKWSNFDEKKKLFLTDLALTGDLFLRVIPMPDKVSFQYILPEDVTMIEEDYRGYLQNIRIEYEIEDENGVLLTHTEYWDKIYFAEWDHTLGKGKPLDQLGTPKNYSLLSAYGLDFCPIVHIKFKDIGNPDHRGVGCVTSSLKVIEEASRQASVMAKTAFRDKQTFVLSAASVDANQFTLEPIKVIKHVGVIDTVPGVSQQDVTPDDIWQAPAMSTITSLLAGINWPGLQALIDATMEELNEEIPALRYWSIKEGSNLAAKTVSLMLDAALSQARESARSFVGGLIRACQIALTMGMYSGLFSGLGDYQSGDFDFDITAGEAFEPTLDERAITLKGLKDAGIELEPAMKLTGFTDDQIIEATQAADAKRTQKVADLKTALAGAGPQNNQVIANGQPAQPA